MGGGSSRGFTLIELLAVIAIIAILAAILFPVFSSARKQSHKSACASNQRQLVQANQMYCDDTGRYAPAAQDLFEFDTKRWFGIRAADGKFQPKSGPLVPYLKDGGLLRKCPSFETTVGFDKGTGGYVYNALGVGSLTWDLGYVAEAFHSSRKPSGIRRPSEVAMFADGALDVGKGLAEYAFLEPPPEVLKRMGQTNPLDPSIHFRHTETALVSFVDSHVKPKRMDESAEKSLVYPNAAPAAHKIGWFGPVTGETPYTPD